MILIKPVTVQRGAFIFCRTSLAVLLWLALVFQAPALVVATAVILAASAALTVSRAPMILLYSWSAGRVWPGGFEVLDERAMRFAHGLGALMTGLCAVLLYTSPRAGYITLVMVALFKTAGACGFCSGLKLYGCATNDDCCAFLAKRSDWPEGLRRFPKQSNTGARSARGPERTDASSLVSRRAKRT